MEGDAPRQCHTTFGIVERASDGGFLLKAYKQKLFVDGLSYLLQEIYGLENKSADVHPNQVNTGLVWISDTPQVESPICSKSKLLVSLDRFTH